MFIASSYMLYSPQAGLTGSVPAPTSAYGGLLNGTASGHFPSSAFASPAVSPFYRPREQISANGHSTANGGDSPCSPARSSPDIAARKVGGGFSVSDILEHTRTDRLDSVQLQPKTAACVVVSRRSPSCASSDTRSLSPATPPPLTTGRSTSVSPPRLSRLQLKFGIDRILAEDVTEPSKRFKDSYSECAPSSPLPASYTCCSVSPAARVPRLPAPPHVTSGGCECAHPFCDGRGNVFHPIYATYPTAALTHALGYPTCAIYPSSPHLNSDLDPLLRPHHLHNHHHHHHLHHQNTNGAGSSALNGNAVGSAGHHQHHALNASSGKRKRSWSRAVFSNLQRKGLEKRFQIQKYITKPDRRQLAATLGLTDAQVKVWFQNRRMKWRHSKEAKEELNKQTTNKTDAKTTDLKPNNVSNSNNLKNADSSTIICSLKPSENNTSLSTSSSKNNESKVAGAPVPTTAAPLATITGSTATK